MKPHHKTWPVAGLLFASGFCALVYQIGWVREFRLIFGASTAASAAVLAIFIGGLGLGGWLLGRRADAHTHPLALYAQLEGIVALSAAERFGTRSPLSLGAAVNLLAPTMARWVGRDLGAIPANDDPADTVVEAQAPVGFVLTASAIVGFAFFLMEMVW